MPSTRKSIKALTKFSNEMATIPPLAPSDYLKQIAKVPCSTPSRTSSPAVIKAGMKGGILGASPAGRSREIASSYN
jgi:hypothetical protein